MLLAQVSKYPFVEYQQLDECEVTEERRDRIPRNLFMALSLFLPPPLMKQQKQRQALLVAVVVVVVAVVVVVVVVDVVVCQLVLNGVIVL